MPNTRAVRALVSAFNAHNYARNIVKTNFTLQSRCGEDCIIVSFGKGMGKFQCSRYLASIKRKIVGEIYGIEEGDTDDVVLNTANLIFDIQSFPFNTSEGSWYQDKQGMIEFLVPIDKGVIFNLKSHLAALLAKNVIEVMPTCNIRAPGGKGYLWHGEFDNKELRKEFESEFLSMMENRYGYRSVFKKPLKVKGNSVYIKDVFDDARFVDSVTQRVAWLVGMYLGVDSGDNRKARLFKDMIVESIGESTGVTICGFVCASPLNRKEASILIPIVLDSGRKRILTNEEALKLNYAFNYAVFNDHYGRTQGELLVNGSNVLYGIDFSNKKISHCVITKIIESSVINKDHELAIAPGRGLLPAQSPFNSPIYEGPSGLRTPPSKRKKDTDSGYDSNSPPKPKNSGASSYGPGPSTELSETECETPVRSQDGVLKESPRQGFVSVPQSCPLDVPGTSGGPSEEEKNLFKELLYAFNLNNYILECPNTNFIVKNGKIGLISDDINVKEYLEELVGYIIKRYCDTEEEAYDLDEFPFKFLSNCEKNQETTVVANISSGALFNLKKLFIQEHNKGVKIEDIDIDIVKEAVKSKKDVWVDSQVKKGIARPHEAITTCFPDESELEHIRIIKDKGGYCLDRTYSDKEVKLFLKERRCAKGTSVAGKVKFEDNKDSGYSSGFLADAEKVSSEADAITGSGYESMDCGNTRGGSPKRKSPEPLPGSSAAKKARSESDISSFEWGVGSPRPGLSDSTLEQVREQINKIRIPKW